MPKKAESYKDVMDDFEKKIMPGVLHWNHPNFFAYFGAGNAYPSVLGDMLSSGIAAIGFSWVSFKWLKKKEVRWSDAKEMMIFLEYLWEIKILSKKVCRKRFYYNETAQISGKFWDEFFKLKWISKQNHLNCA